MTAPLHRSPASEERAGPVRPAPAEVSGEAALNRERYTVVTDCWMRAVKDFPGAAIVYRLDDVCALPDGAAIAIVQYGWPGGVARGHPAITAARALAAKGLLEVVAMEF